jgi:indole-3-acetate monooxygenase
VSMFSQVPLAGSDGREAEVELLLATIASRRAEFRCQRHISADVIELMKKAGIYRAMVARRFGGDETTPSEFLRLVETISAVDGSAGWVASFGFSAVYLSALPLKTLEVMYRDTPDIVFAGGIFPPQRAVVTGEGLRVSGRWSWGSGSMGAAYIGVGIKTEEGPSSGLPLIAVMPCDKVKIAENWDVNGMQGTGSHDLVVDDVLVDPEWTFVRGGKSSLDGPLYRYPTMALAAQVLAVVGLGIARGALDELRCIASGRQSITGAPVLASRAYIQIELAKAEAQLRSARAFFYDATDAAYEKLARGEELDLDAVTLLRLASSHAARTGSDVARAAYTMSGTSGIFRGNAIAQAFQDASVIPQHAFLSEGTWQSAGAVLLGLNSPAGFP